MYAEVAAAAVTGVFSVIVIILEKKRRIAHRKSDATERELKFQAAALSWDDFVSEWAELNDEILRLIADTNIDRFLILRAWNGSMSPLWATAFLQIRDDGQMPVAYIHVELDDDYVERLHKTVRHGHIVFGVGEQPDGVLIKGIYTAEGVKHSAWFFVSKRELEGSDSAALTYCSFATHKDEPIDEGTLTRCKLIVSRLKGLASAAP